VNQVNQIYNIYWFVLQEWGNLLGSFETV